MPGARTPIFLILSVICSMVSPQLFEWREDRHRRRMYKDSDDEDIGGGNSLESTTSRSTLNVRDENGPYALIDRFFFEREKEHERRKDLYALKHSRGEVPDPPKGLKPEDIWLSQGNLLVLKGGTSDESAPASEWEPLDDYVAPYREPKLPPPDFVPSDVGVGVPLMDEEGDKYLSTTTVSPIAVKTLKPYSYDEEDFIYDMEHFHSARQSPASKTTTSAPTIYVTAPPPYHEDPRVATHRPVLLRWKDYGQRPQRNEIDNEETFHKLKESRTPRKRFFRRAPRLYNSIRRSGDRYVTFYRGSARGGRSWGYSYNF